MNPFKFNLSLVVTLKHPLTLNNPGYQLLLMSFYRFLFLFSLSGSINVFPAVMCLNHWNYYSWCGTNVKLCNVRVCVCVFVSNNDRKKRASEQTIALNIHIFQHIKCNHLVYSMSSHVRWMSKKCHLLYVMCSCFEKMRQNFPRQAIHIIGDCIRGCVCNMEIILSSISLHGMHILI